MGLACSAFQRKKYKDFKSPMVRILEPKPDPEKLKITHKYYELFLQQNLITPDMKYVAYRVKNGKPQFILGALGLDEMVKDLEKKEGVPRESCLFMELSNHRNYVP